MLLTDNFKDIQASLFWPIRHKTSQEIGIGSGINKVRIHRLRNRELEIKITEYLAIRNYVKGHK